ncbi:hypothetical protein LZ30DRAFT_292565 [Colletotrichum cereale]|nr:hypothetical protein LZ30DRAFT_292565 [Colletotrichum cereale]
MHLTDISFMYACLFFPILPLPGLPHTELFSLTGTALFDLAMLRGMATGASGSTKEAHTKRGSSGAARETRARGQREARWAWKDGRGNWSTRAEQLEEGNPDVGVG